MVSGFVAIALLTSWYLNRDSRERVDWNDADISLRLNEDAWRTYLHDRKQDDLIGKNQSSAAFRAARLGFLSQAIKHILKRNEGKHHPRGSIPEPLQSAVTELLVSSPVASDKTTRDTKFESVRLERDGAGHLLIVVVCNHERHEFFAGAW